MTTLTERQAEFCGYFIAAGYPMRSAAAIGGNATQENKCLPVTEGVKDHGSDGALQWRVERLSRLKSLPGWDTLKTQAQFTILELQAAPGTQFFDMDYHRLEADLRAGAKSLETLTLNFVDAYERPSEVGRAANERISFAHNCLAVLVRNSGAFPVPAPTLPTLPTEDLQMPIELILQLVGPLAERLVAGLFTSVLTHAQQTGVVPTAHPASPPPVVATAPGLSAADLAKIEAMVEALVAKLIQPKAA